nr:uncharacterized protein LOC112039329 [Quercus suber]POE91346.1 hypothetical protein CFP56_44515 [Quercus suber]
MLSESMNPTNSSSGGGDNQKSFDRDVRQMVSAITQRLGDLKKSGSSTQQVEGDDEHGLRVITLAGTNSGANLRSELDEKSKEDSLVEYDSLSTYVNSNFQAINNSIMMGGSYTTNDPGVHLDITDIQENHGHKPGHKHGKKGKKKEKDSQKSDHTEHSDGDHDS